MNDRITSTAPDTQAITDAYLYLLARALVIRQERHDVSAAGTAYNTIKYKPARVGRLRESQLRCGVSRSVDRGGRAESGAAQVPAVTGRYDTAQILDEWGEVIVNINERTFPSRSSGEFVLVAPNSRAALPQGAGVITLHSKKAKMLARVELKGDPAGAVALQKQFTLKLLGTPAIAAPPTLVEFDNKSLIGAQIFDKHRGDAGVGA